jgi:hypothetical protein
MYVPLVGGTLLMQWGSVTMAGTSVAVTFPIAFATACDIVQLTPTALDAAEDGMYASTIGTTGFVINSASTASATVYWVAWGH